MDVVRTGLMIYIPPLLLICVWATVVRVRDDGTVHMKGREGAGGEEVLAALLRKEAGGD